MLEAAAESGLVAVRYDGCELEVLSRCSLEGAYEYRGLTHKRDEVRIRDEDALWAELPLGAARLEAALAREGQLNVDMAVVGRLQANTDRITPSSTASSCDRATHLVTGMTVGAFAMYTVAALEGRGAVTLGNAGGGARLSRSTETLRQDGDMSACDTAHPGDASTPAQCGALLRVELDPIGRDGVLTSEERGDDHAEADRLERVADRWHGVRSGAMIAAGVAATGAIASVVVLGVRSFQIGDAEDDRNRERDDLGGPFENGTEREEIERLDAQIADHERDRRAATGAAIGLTIATAGLAGLAAAARGRRSKLRARARLLRSRTTLAPILGPGLAGLTLQARF